MTGWYSAAEACALSGVSAKTLKNWSERGILPFERFGGRRAYSLDAVVAAAAGQVYFENEADTWRVTGVVRFLADLGLERLERELAAGNDTPALPAVVGAGPWFSGMMVRISDEDLAAMGEGPRGLLARLSLAEVVARVKKAAKLNAANVKA